METIKLKLRPSSSVFCLTTTVRLYLVHHMRLKLVIPKQNSQTLRISSSLLLYCYKLDEKDSLGIS